MTDATRNFLHATSLLGDALEDYREALLAVADQFDDRFVTHLLWQVEHLGDEVGELREELVGEPVQPVFLTKAEALQLLLKLGAKDTARRLNLLDELAPV